MRKNQVSDYEYRQVCEVIRDMTRIYGRGLDKEECASVSWIAYLEMRNTMKGMRNQELLWTLAVRRIEQALRELRRSRNDRIQCESTLSLDQEIGGSDEPMSVLLGPSQGDFADSVCMWSHVNGLERKQYDESKRQLKKDMKEYFES